MSKLIHLQIQNGDIVILTEEQYKKVPRFDWRVTRLKPDVYTVSYHKNYKSHFMYQYVFEYDSLKDTIVFPDGHLNFSTAYVTPKKGRKRNFDNDNVFRFLPKLPKEGVLVNGCLMKGSKIDGNRCEKNWRCEHYLSCIDYVCETSEIGWEADGKGFIDNGLSSCNTWVPDISILKEMLRNE